MDKDLTIAEAVILAEKETGKKIAHSTIRRWCNRKEIECELVIEGHIGYAIKKKSFIKYLKKRGIIT